jgi:hypothetical protein
MPQHRRDWAHKCGGLGGGRRGGNGGHPPPAGVRPLGKAASLVGAGWVQRRASPLLVKRWQGNSRRRTRIPSPRSTSFQNKNISRYV